MTRKEKIGYLIQAGAAVVMAVGVYFAFDLAKVFWPIVGGAGAWYVGKFVRKEF